jgi:1,4-dihydroxy-2-naphthoate polyprenyltransferase
MTTETGRVGSTPTKAAAKARAYARLAKLDIFDYYLGLLIVWALLPATGRLHTWNLLILVVFALGEVAVIAAAVAFDDVTGYHDGSDATNYGPDAPARRLARKPLLTGALSPPEAVRFGWAATAAGALLWAASVVLAPHRPTWAIAVAAICLVSFVQYSWGLKLSYYALGEVVLTILGMSVVLVPYGLLSGTAGGFVIVQALLFGLGPVLFGVYSNTNDIAGDARASRRTLATTLSCRGNAAYIGVVSLVETLIIIGSTVIRVAPWWFPVVMLPTMALRVIQYAIGFRRGDILRARKLGIWTHRTTVVLLVVVNLLYPLAEKS